MHSVPAPEDSRWFRVAIRSFLLASMFLLHAVEARPERIPSCDACQTIQGQIDDLNKRISDLEQHKVGQFGKQGEPLKPPPQDPEVAAKISSLQQQVDALKTQLQRCEKPSPDPPPLAFRLQTAGINPPDPQIAVGHKYFAAFSTTMLAFFEKSTRTQVTSGLGFPNNNGFIDGITLFQPLFKTLDAAMHLPNNVCPSDPSQIDGHNDLFDPAHPNRAIPGCIKDVDDMRALYDEQRHRFWILISIRNRLWPCPHAGPPFTGLSIGCGSEQTTCGTQDPGTDYKGQKCHGDWDTSWPHRFIGLAVTQVDSNGREDLSKPPFLYGLFDDYADFPLMALHENYLMLSHWDRADGTADPVAIYDAGRLAHPGPGDDGSFMGKTLDTYTPGRLTLQEAGAKLTPEHNVYPVNVYGSTPNSFLVSTSGDSMMILGFRSPQGNPSGKPELLKGTTIPLGQNHQSPRHNPEYRDGMLYVSWQECNDVNHCTKTVIRVLRVPVDVVDNSIVASVNPKEGFLDCRFEDAEGTDSLQMPMVTVNKNDDIVIAFERFNIASRVPTGVRYRIWYYDHGNISEGAWIKQGEPFPSNQDSPDPTGGGVVDLGASVLDPEDHKTVWMSHAFSDSKGDFREVVAAVKP